MGANVALWHRKPVPAHDTGGLKSSFSKEPFSPFIQELMSHTAFESIKPGAHSDFLLNL